MFAVLDCGTTTTRIYLVDDEKKITASVRGKVGVRDTAKTGSKEVLSQGIVQLFAQLMDEAGAKVYDLDFIIASGMITSEIGLIELPHLVCPVGINELVSSIYKADPNTLLPIDLPVYFVRGVRNHYDETAGLSVLRDIDFMRGEEVQIMGLVSRCADKLPCSIVTLSSHTKLSYVDENGRIVASSTSISGQLFDALLTSTSIGKSLSPCDTDVESRFSFEELFDMAQECVENVGLSRSFLVPRFMNVLMESSCEDRRTFVDAAIAVDDLKAFKDLRSKGLSGGTYILYGQENRCKMYEYMLRKHFGKDLDIICLGDQEEQDMITAAGMIEIASRAQSEIKACVN